MKRKREGCVQVVLEDDIRIALREAADREERSQSAIIRRALRKYLGMKVEK